MDIHLNQISDAYAKYSVTPTADNLKRLGELTGRKDLGEILEATDALVKEAHDVKGLERLQAAIGRLDSERRILLDRRIQDKARGCLNGRMVRDQLANLSQAIVLRIRLLTGADEVQKRLQCQIFGLCCERYQEKIEARTTKILGPSTYDIMKDPEFLQDAQAFNKISSCSNPTEKLAFFTDHVNELQDKYLPGGVKPEQLCQLLIIMFSHAANPQLLSDIEEVDRCLPAQQKQTPLGSLLQAANRAVLMIQQEALQEVDHKKNA